MKQNLVCLYSQIERQLLAENKQLLLRNLTLLRELFPLMDPALLTFDGEDLVVQTTVQN